jgi:hypothetical protein
MKILTSRSVMVPETVFKGLCALSSLRTAEGSTVLFRQGETPKRVLLVLRGHIALMPDAREPSLCRVSSAGAVLGLRPTWEDRPTASPPSQPANAKLSSCLENVFLTRFGAEYAGKERLPMHYERTR